MTRRQHGNMNCLVVIQLFLVVFFSSHITNSILRNKESKSICVHVPFLQHSCIHSCLFKILYSPVHLVLLYKPKLFSCLNHPIEIVDTVHYIIVYVPHTYVHTYFQIV